MPLYSYRCIDKSCRAVSDYWRPMERTHETATYSRCGCVARRIISPPLRIGERTTMEPEQLRTSEEVWR